MRIGIICNPWLGGAGAVATELGIELAKRGHKVHFVCFDVPFRLIGPWRKNVYYHQVETLEYPAFKAEPYTLALANKIYDVAKIEKLEILNAHYAGPNSIAIYLTKQMLSKEGTNIKTIVTLHGTDVSILANEPTLKDIIGFSIRMADGATTVSKNYAQQAKEVYNLKSIRSIYNFVDPAIYKRKENKELREIFANKEEKIIAHASNFRSIKRVEDVIKIFNGTQKKIPAKLILIGDGPDLRLAHRLTAKFNILDKVHFMGIQTNIAKMLSISDLFLFPSEKESFGLAALEAMACEIPVITTKTGGIPEVITDGKNGYLSEVGDIKKMTDDAIKLLFDEKLYKDMSKNARRSVEEKFSSEKIIPEYEKYFLTVLGKNKAK